MCGIAGVVDLSGRLATHERLTRMADAMVHRGPDDHGVDRWDSGAGVVGCSFRRLAILDLSAAAHQPMVSDDGRHRLVFNGEIYNHPELRRELELLGHRFASTGDTEVLLAALSTWGLDALPRLDGMFAFGWLDTAERRLHLVRDAFGIKPLFWTAWPDGLAYASELAPLLDLEPVARVADPAWLHDYLYFALTDHTDRSAVASIRQIRPGHVAIVPIDAPGRIEHRRWWSPSRTGPLDVSLDEAASLVREQFLTNVDRHLRSDVPVGAALSGGIDSSGIVGAIRSIGGPAVDLHVFSFVTRDPGLDEERWIELAAADAGATLHKIELDATDLVDGLDDVLRSQGEPVVGSTVYAQSQVFASARAAGITVMLDGQGADELFGGYRAHLTMRCESLLRRGDLGAAWNLLRNASRLPGGDGPARALARLLWWSLPERLAMAARRQVGARGSLGAVHHRWFGERGITGAPHRPPAASDRLVSMLMGSLTDSSLPGLLRYEDRNSMRSSIESRVPFLTTAMADLVYSLPEEHLVARDGTTKAVLRRALDGIAPAPILARRDKIGFGAPESRWLRAAAPWVEGVLDVDTVPSGLVDRDHLRRRWMAVVDGSAQADPALWRVLNVVRWSQLTGVEVA